MDQDVAMDLYSIKDAAVLLETEESRLLYWIQTGIVAASVKKGGRLWYTRDDLTALEAAKKLFESGEAPAAVRKSLEELRTGATAPSGELGERIAALAELRPAEPPTAVKTADAPAPVPTAVDDSPTEATEAPSAYAAFLEGTAAEERGDLALSEIAYRRALDLEPGMAAARVNLGNLMYRRGDVEGARAAYEQALDHDPTQPEARFNLGNLLEDLGETEQAIAELRRVCWIAPDFADAHYNLGLMLARVGGKTQARRHLERYLELDEASEWALRARDFLGRLES